MSSEKISHICQWSPELEKLNFDNFDTLVKTLISENKSLWSIVSFLIYHQVVDYFEIRPSKHDSIYTDNYFGNGDKNLIVEISQSTDLTFPILKMPSSRLQLCVSIIAIWIVLLTIYLSSNPEFLFFGTELLLFNAFLFLVFPVTIPFFLFPKWMSKRKFKNVETFKDLAERLFVINLYKYKINEFKRLKLELKQYLK